MASVVAYFRRLLSSFWAEVPCSPKGKQYLPKVDLEPSNVVTTPTQPGYSETLEIASSTNKTDVRATDSPGFGFGSAPSGDNIQATPEPFKTRFLEDAQQENTDPGVELTPPSNHQEIAEEVTPMVGARWVVNDGKRVGVDNTVAKYHESRPVVVHATPFGDRILRELDNEQLARERAAALRALQQQGV